MHELSDLGFVHIQLFINGPQMQQFGYALLALRGRKNLRRYFANLWGEHAEPDLSHFRFGSPEPKKFL